MRVGQAWRVFALTVAILAAATLLRWLLDPALGNHLPYVTYFVAVALIAWLGGVGPAIFAAFAGSYLAEFLFFPPRYTWFPYDLTVQGFFGTLTYFMVTGMTILLTESMRRAQRNARDLHGQLETELRATRTAQDSLHESELRKGAILENALDAIISMDAEGRVVDFNPAAERIFGYTHQAAVGKPLAELIIPPRLREAHWKGLKSFLESGEGPILNRRIEMPAVRSSGEEFPVELAVTSVSGDGRPRFFTGYLRDISQRKRDEELLKQALDDAHRSSLLKDEFLATLSHELRTPMTAILGWAQMLQTPEIGRNPHEVNDGLEVIERNARLQSRIIDDLLDMSRIVSGRLRLDVQSVKLGEVVAAAVDAVRPAALAKSLRLENICDPNVSDIRGDAARLQQIVYNLLSNAIKFTPKGGRVQVVCSRVNSHIEISVSDTGAGIKPEFLEHVFERFRQQDSSTGRSHSGLGLGLAIVKNLVELHGGTVQAASEGEGRGATFTLHLPVAIAIKPNLPAQALAREHPVVGGTTAAPEELNAPELGGRTVLVVEDERDARAMLCRLLTLHGMRCLEAGTGDEALRLLHEGAQPDLIISDLGLPGKNGYDLIAEIRKLAPDQGGSTPAIALTAFARTEDRVRSLMAGYQLHLSKPVETTELIATTVRLLQRNA